MFCAGRYFTLEVTPWQNIYLKSYATGNIFPVSTQIQAISNTNLFSKNNNSTGCSWKQEIQINFENITSNKPNLMERHWPTISFAIFHIV